VIRGRKRPAQDDEARQALDRAVAIMRSYQRADAAEVPVADVLELLGAGPGTVPRPEKTLDPHADPMTGAKWAGPPGSSPPGSS
jgi:hypothetical protein